MIGLIIAFAVGLVLSISLTPLFIRYLVHNHYGQFIRQDGPTSHMTKRGTPTMGGVVIIFATVVAWFIGTLINGGLPSWSGILLVFLFVGIGFIGLLDDALKIMHQRSLGLHAWAKIVGQVAIASLFTWGILTIPNVHGRTPGIFDISLARPLGLTFTQWGIVAAVILIVLWVNFIVAAWSNAVNLTDGLDGLAAGAGIFVFVAYTFISYFQLLQSCWGDTVNVAACYDTRDPLSIAIFCSSLVGALAGFLWWNASPAQIFMGDTGSQAIGAAVAGVSILTDTEFLAILIGGLYVITTMSDVIQIGVFKLTHKRVFRMAPLHHHFELKGWKEITIVIRFWLIAALFAVMGTGLFYAEWVSRL